MVLGEVGVDELAEQELVETQERAPAFKPVGLEAMAQDADDLLCVLEPLVRGEEVADAERARSAISMSAAIRSKSMTSSCGPGAVWTAWLW